MNSSPLNFVTTNEILSDVLSVVDDENFKLRSKGYYTSQIQQALEELAFESFFDEQYQSFDIPERLRLDLPKGMFNIKNIYLFNGDECDISKSTPVYNKQNFINSKSGNGYVANNKGNNGDDRFHGDTARTTVPDGLYFYGVQNGQIMLSSNCKSFQKVFIQYNGIGQEIDEAPIVPIFLRQAVKDYVAIKVLQVKIAKVPASDFQRWMMILGEHKQSKGTDYSGTWFEAQRRVRRLDDKERNDIKENMQKMYY